MRQNRTNPRTIIIKAMATMGINAAELARRSGISEGYLSRMLSNQAAQRRYPSLDVLISLENALDLEDNTLVYLYPDALITANRERLVGCQALGVLISNFLSGEVDYQSLAQVVSDVLEVPLSSESEVDEESILEHQ